MRRPCLIFCCLALLTVLAAPASAQVRKGGRNPNPKAGKNQTDGFIWEYQGQEVVEGKLTGAKMSGRFRVSDSVVYKGPKRIGVVRPHGPSETTLTITDWPELNGTVTLKKTGFQPPLWQGSFKKDDGTRWRWGVRFVKN